MTDYTARAHDLAMQLTREACGMAPDYTRLSLDHLEAVDQTPFLSVKEEHLSKANTYALLALTETLTKKKLGANWAGMDGNE